jgi:hypothetical protein
MQAYDRGYGNAKFVQATEKIEADLLLRLASNRCVWGDPGAYRTSATSTSPLSHCQKTRI